LFWNVVFLLCSATSWYWRSHHCLCVKHVFYLSTAAAWT
jgi:hypothetical protein